MEHTFERPLPGGACECVPLFAGMELSYLDIVSDSFPHRHKAMGHIMQVNYCRAGQVAWNMRRGGSIFLNPGDFSVHTLDICADSVLQFPTGQYQGLSVSIDLREVSAHPPELIGEAGFFSGILRERYCRSGTAAFLAGTEESERIFSAFYGQPESLRLPYQRLKALELLLYLAQLETEPETRLTEFPAGQIEMIRSIHDQFLQHMERRITIEALSRQYHINPTTLKAAFKAVYGASLAAHIKKHRMERAAGLLRETGMSVAEVAHAVGYESQSRFAAAFKNQFSVLPSAYRRQCGTSTPPAAGQSSRR